MTLREPMVGMVIRSSDGESRIVAINDTHMTLGLSRGRRKKVPLDTFKIDQVIEVPLPTRAPVQNHTFRAVRSLVADQLTFEPAMLSWMLAACEVPNGGEGRVTVVGSAPFSRDTLVELLTSLRFDVGPSSADTEILIVGRTDWTQDQLKELLDMRVGQSLRVYSQEMAIAWILSGCDPFECKNPELIRQLGSDHLALTCLEAVLGFRWPSTLIVPSHLGADGSFDALEKSYLKHEGYTVGKHGLPNHKRQTILMHCYRHGRVPEIFPEWYIQQWGPPGSSSRLHKIADTIAAACRNHKRHRTHSLQAIEDWENDLAWLCETYYQGQYQFQWPGTDVW